MSRCFPFPPPGYEKKPRSDDVDLLTKEKDKKKKHKREKKNKEKQDGKERKHNGKSKDKHKEKKDRKEKHKGKRRHKDRDKEKIAVRRTEERVPGQNGNKVHDSINDIGEVKDSIFTDELSKRYKGDGATNRMSENTNCSVHASESCRSQNSMEKERHNRMEMVVDNTCKQQSRNDGSCKYSDQRNEGNKKSKVMSPLAINISNRDNKEYDERGKSMEKELDKRNAEEHQALDKRDMDIGNGLKNQRRSKVLAQPVQKGDEKTEWTQANDKQKMAQFIVKSQTNNERLHGDAGKHIEESEKPKVRELDGGMPNHHGHKDQEEKKLKKKDKERHKKEMERDKHKHKHKEHVKSKDIQEQHQLVTQCKSAKKDNEKHADGEEHLKKRKDQMKNGFFNEIDLRPNKLPRPIENGRMIESCYLPAPSPSKLGGVNSNIEEHKALGKSKNIMNGALSVDSRSSVPADMSQHDGISLKAPHPDTKYLETVYSVPKMEDWLEFDDHDWLFHNNGSRIQPQADAMTDEMVPQVWSEGQKIESADVFALPYVIPY